MPRIPTKTGRNAKIVALFKEFKTYAFIGKKFGLSKSRVCEIVHKELTPKEVESVTLQRIKKNALNRTLKYLEKHGEA